MTQSRIPLATGSCHTLRLSPRKLYAIDGTEADRSTKSNVWIFGKDHYAGPKNYFDGVGSGGWFKQYKREKNTIPSAFGIGCTWILDHVLATIRGDLERHPNLEIDIVGWSRGAAIALEVAHALNDGDKGIAKGSRVRFLGLWDPVHSMGYPLGAGGSLLSDANFYMNETWRGFASGQVPANVSHASVVYAKHERRIFFRPTRLSASSPSTQLSIHWSPGEHVIGGFRSPYQAKPGTKRKPAEIVELQDLALNWMLLEAWTAGALLEKREQIPIEIALSYARRMELEDANLLPKGEQRWIQRDDATASIHDPYEEERRWAK